jgi:hypothetical protein
MINGLGGLGDLRPFASSCNTEAQNSSRTPLGQLIVLAVALHRSLAINGLGPAGIAHGSYGSGCMGLGCLALYNSADDTFDKKTMPKNDGARKPE